MSWGVAARRARSSSPPVNAGVRARIPPLEAGTCGTVSLEPRRWRCSANTLEGVRGAGPALAAPTSVARIGVVTSGSDRAAPVPPWLPAKTASLSKALPRIRATGVRGAEDAEPPGTAPLESSI